MFLLVQTAEDKSGYQYLSPSLSHAYWRQYSSVKLSTVLGWTALQRSVAVSHSTVHCSVWITGTEGAEETQWIELLIKNRQTANPKFVMINVNTTYLIWIKNIYILHSHSVLVDLVKRLHKVISL